MERRLFVIQRVSAMLLAPLVLLHLGLIMYAVNNGLSGTEILGRTQGSLVWGSFYSVFVVAVALHAPIGLRNILREWTAMSWVWINSLCVLFSAMLLALGLRAVLAVI